MTIDDILGLTTEQLEAMSDADLHKLLSPLLLITRPASNPIAQTTTIHKKILKTMETTSKAEQAMLRLQAAMRKMGAEL